MWEAIKSVFKKKRVRVGIYSVAVAFIPLAVAKGWMDAPTGALVLPLILALLNLTPDDVTDAAAESDDNGEAA